MLNYADTLAGFAHTLENEAADAGCVSAATRRNLAIYRNNVRLNRIDALESAFPTVLALVGRDWFRAMARAYVGAEPAASANLHDDGWALGAFLDGFGPAQTLPYLADVARFDWARHRAWFAEDAAALDPVALAGIDPERFARQRLHLHPSLALVVSGWPLADIAAMHDGGPPAQPDAGGQSVLVWREGWCALTADEAGWLGRLLAGDELGDALASAADDPNPLLARLFSTGLVCALEEGGT
ncbi:HvfC/BufC N-terminal domain-containing protein [Jeongeupia chitinilytica]|uniref:DUF2063 domain-containing protein n=1 Tax=Jeongeupia chitinilytica TaxID=1041641 RepID=A0ABQ3H3M3_9NEIS|nr:DNA-binding domain-containing protein [Jeongeupia chitinilytica]GHD66904.1 DUF2063 domain-containing protein [Jeongeupia chitinilytica]